MYVRLGYVEYVAGALASVSGGEPRRNVLGEKATGIVSRRMRINGAGVAATSREPENLEAPLGVLHWCQRAKDVYWLSIDELQGPIPLEGGRRADWAHIRTARVPPWVVFVPVGRSISKHTDSRTDCSRGCPFEGSHASEVFWGERNEGTVDEDRDGGRPIPEVLPRRKTLGVAGPPAMSHRG